MRWVSGECALCSARGESRFPTREPVREPEGSEAVPSLPSATCPKRRILLEMICCWLYSLLRNVEIVPNAVLEAPKSLRWGKWLQQSCCGPAPLPGRPLRHHGTTSAAAGTAVGLKYSILAFPGPRVTGAGDSDGCEGLPRCLRGACARGGRLGAPGMRGQLCGCNTGSPAPLEGGPRAFRPPGGAEGARGPPAWGTGKGLLRSPRCLRFPWGLLLAAALGAAILGLPQPSGSLP